MANPWIALRGVLPADAVTEGTVTASLGGGEYSVQTFRGGAMTCRSSVPAAVGDEVKVVNGRIEEVLESVVTFYIVM
jgi:hypothetical protein